jgi:hypothetical protein
MNLRAVQQARALQSPFVPVDARIDPPRHGRYDCYRPRLSPLICIAICMKAYHDLGGTPAGPIDRAEHDLQLWEKRIEALLVLLKNKNILRVDENRRGLESLGSDVYFSLSYAERRMLSMSNNLILKGVITIDELVHKIAEIESRKDPLP